MKLERIKRIKQKMRRQLDESTSDIEENTSGSNLGGLVIYIFFLIHMLAFGGSGFAMAYFSESADLFFLYIHGGIAIFVYLQFYNALFGRDAVRWMVINALLGIFGIYSELRIFLDFFDKDITDYSIFVHAIPFTYYVLYTFLLYQTVLLLTNAAANPLRKLLVELTYIAISFGAYFFLYSSY